MVSLSLVGVAFSIDAIDEGTQLNFIDQNTGVVVHVPFDHESVVKLMISFGNVLTDDQKRQILPHLMTSEIVIPNIDLPPQEGPQG